MRALPPRDRHGAEVIAERERQVAHVHGERPPGGVRVRASLLVPLRGLRECFERISGAFFVLEWPTGCS